MIAAGEIQILADIRTHLVMQIRMIYTQSPAQTIMRMKTAVGYLWAKVAQVISNYTQFITNMKYDDLNKYYQLHIAQTNMGQKIELLMSQSKVMCQKIRTMTKAMMDKWMQKIHFVINLLMDKGSMHLPKLAQMANLKLRMMIQKVMPGLEYHYDQVIQLIAIKSSAMKNKVLKAIHDIKVHSAIMKEFLIALRHKLIIKFHRMMNSMHSPSSGRSRSERSMRHRLMEWLLQTQSSSEDLQPIWQEKTQNCLCFEGLQYGLGHLPQQQNIQNRPLTR